MQRISQHLYKPGLLILFTFLIIIDADSQQSVAIDTTITKQKDVIDVLVKLFKISPAKADSSRQNKKVHFSLVPTGASSPGGGTAIITALNASFYTGTAPSTSLSTVTFSPWFTFDGKFVFPIRQLIWFPDNNYLSKGDTRFMIYPHETWGLSGNNEKEENVELDYNYVRVYQSVLKKVGKEILLGAGYALDHHYSIKINGDTSQLVDMPLYEYKNQLQDKTTSTGPVLNFLIDSRRIQLILRVDFTFLLITVLI